MLSYYERQNSPEVALQIAENTFNAYKLHRDLSSYGNELKTYHCRIIDPRTKQIFYGCGKGLGIQSRLSASFEALEHYAVHYFCQEQSRHLEHYYPLNDLQIIECKLPPSSHKIPMTLITNVISGEQLYYPLYLIDPRYSNHPNPMDTFDYKPYAWNVCDSGIASGSSFEEASLHALNESIERDAYSLFLIRTFILKESIRLIDKNSVSAHLQDLIHTIEKDCAEELFIIDITSDIGVPSFFVTMTRQSMAIQPMGCGTSLNKEYALERALLECLQPLHIYNHHLAENQQHILHHFAKTPLLAQCAKVDLTLLQDQFQYIDFNSLPSYPQDLRKTKHSTSRGLTAGSRNLATSLDPAVKPRDVETESIVSPDPMKTTVTEQLDIIIQKIHSQGLAMYSLKIAETDSGFHCVKYIIPQFEQFYLVEIGKFVLPNQRGMALIEHSLKRSLY